MNMCNYCRVKEYKKRAKERGNKIVLRPSNFMDGITVLEVVDGELIPKYKEPCDALPNGDEWYNKHRISWMMEIGDSCDC